MGAKLISGVRIKKFSWCGAFTIIELLITVTVIIILASIMTVHLLRGQHYSRYSLLKKWVKTVADATEMYEAVNGGYPPNVTALTTTNPPFLQPEIANRCGTVEGHWNLICTYDDSGTAVYNYLIYAQESIDTPSQFQANRHGPGSLTPGRIEITDIFEGQSF